MCSSDLDSLGHDLHEEGSGDLRVEGHLGGEIAGGLDGFSLILSFALFALELFVGFLQAYVFTVLSAQYVASSISEGH